MKDMHKIIKTCHASYAVDIEINCTGHVEVVVKANEARALGELGFRMVEVFRINRDYDNNLISFRDFEELNNVEVGNIYNFALEQYENKEISSGRLKKISNHELLKITLA